MKRSCNFRFKKNFLTRKTFLLRNFLYSKLNDRKNFLLIQIFFCNKKTFEFESLSKVLRKSFESPSKVL